MTTCTECSGLLDEYLDATLSPEDRALVADHLETCSQCRAELVALRSIVGDARALPSSVTPARDLWSGIEPRLTRPIPGVRGLPWRSLGRLAAAIGFILLGAGLALVWTSSGSSGFAADQARYNAASAELARKLAEEPLELSAATRAVVERNLAIVDAAIREAESALDADPGNIALERMLLARYEQRLDLLRRATDANRIQS